ncbi:MAG TPA: SpoIID/LytB domain-containing protein [Blastocatellia bacterium]|nr:SpoIID/LytB domain-containing protein [Blastocatellia bacterium]
MGVFRRVRGRRSISLAVVISASVFLQSFAVNSDSRKALAAGGPQGDNSLRPRRAENPSKRGPLIRVGVMVDVAAVTLTSPAGLVVRDSGSGDADAHMVTSGQLRADVRKASVSTPAPSSSPLRPTVYRVEVAAVNDERRARQVVDDLEAKFFEPVAVVFDREDKKHRVFIGKYKEKDDAAKMIARLSRAGYRGASVVPEPPPAASGSVSSHQDSRKAPIERTPQVVALDANRVVAASAAALVVAPGGDSLEGTSYRPAYKSTEAALRDDVALPPRRNSELQPARAPTVRLGGKEYRGQVHLVLNSRGRINVVNVLPLEDYLRGVVPLELSPGGFPALEALKAQAVAARTYALANINRFGGQGFDLTDDTRSQVYGGYAAEHPLTNRAIDETRGIVATYPNAEGREVPINALYSSTCGGRTENSEAIFLTEPVPYLRGVACAPDRKTYQEHEIISGITPDALAGLGGRSIARDVALLQVLGLSLPRRVTGQYLRGYASQDEIEQWTAHAARLAGRPAPRALRGDATRLPVFAQLLAAAIYGEGRASLLMSELDADYALAGMGEDLPREARADIAMLLKDGVLRLPDEGRLNARTPITHGYAVESLARALSLKSQISNSRLQTAVAAPARNNRLIIAPAKKSRSQDEPANEFEVERDAWLFRRLGGESFPVSRLPLIGGERVTFHLNARGRVDFLEAEANERGAASDRFSSAARWQERISAEQLRGRLARFRVNVGELTDLAPVALGTSGRLIEVEVIGRDGRKAIRGQQIRSAFGLKDNLFVIDRELDERGRVMAFVFHGRGWGHGVGMCQVGAYGLAKEGYSYQAILKTYYSGIRLREVY